LHNKERIKTEHSREAEKNINKRTNGKEKR